MNTDIKSETIAFIYLLIFLGIIFGIFSFMFFNLGRYSEITFEDDKKTLETEFVDKQCDDARREGAAHRLPFCQEYYDGF